jgi:hypothetical protein
MRVTQEISAGSILLFVSVAIKGARISGERTPRVLAMTPSSSRNFPPWQRAPAKLSKVRFDGAPKAAREGACAPQNALALISIRLARRTNVKRQKIDCL